MTRRREWPPFLSPGYLALYAISALAIFLYLELFGAAVVLGLLAFGVLLFAAALGGLSGYPRPDRKDDYGEGGP